MVKLEHFDIEFDKRGLSFRAGETVSGRVVLRLKEHIKVKCLKLTATGTTLIEWTDGKKAGTKKYHTSEHHVKEEFTFLPVASIEGEEADEEEETRRRKEIDHSEVHLDEGDYKYPFSFLLPADVPPTFSCPYGEVKYLVKATLSIPWTFDKEVEKELQVKNGLDLRDHPSSTTPFELSDVAYVGICCLVEPVKVSLGLEKTGFIPGESIQVKLCVENRTGKPLTEMTLEILQIIEVVGILKSELVHLDPETNKPIVITKPRHLVEKLATVKLAEQVEAKSVKEIENTSLVVPKCLPSRPDDMYTLRIGYTVIFSVSDHSVEIPILIGASDSSIELQSVSENVSMVDVKQEDSPVVS